MESINFADLLLWYVAFLFSVTAHEAAHALAAMRGGDLTAYQGGQVTLNPAPHVRRSPFGTVVVPILSYVLGGWMIGWASAPYDPRWAERYPRRAAWMAAAGPAANLLLAVLAFLLLKLGLGAGVFEAPQRLNISRLVSATAAVWVPFAKVLSILFMLNLILLVFNLFPFPPLDGSSVITLFMPDQMALRFRQFVSQPAFAFLGIVLAWRAFGAVFSSVFHVILRILHPGVSYF